MSDFSKLEKSIIRTLSWFDIFDQALTIVELHKFLYKLEKKTDLAEVLKSVENSVQVKKIQGFCVLTGREELIEKRISQSKLLQKKIKLAFDATRKIAWIPGVEMVALCNNWYYKDNSDIDFFIIASSGRVWLTRLIVTSTLQLFGLRRHGKKIKNRICLSFYIGDKKSYLWTMRLLPEDPYFDFWTVTLMPLFQRNNAYQSFLNKNKWLQNKFHNFKENKFTLSYKIKQKKKGNLISNVCIYFLNSRIGDWLEKIAKSIQKIKMSGNRNSLSCKKDTRVIINDEILKFHENDRRDKYRAVFYRNYKKYKK